MKYFEWEYFLRQYIDISVRWKIFSGTLVVLKYYFENGRTQWEIFKQQFREQKIKLNEIEKGNFYTDLKNDFFPMIENYLKWYERNMNELKAVEKGNIVAYSALLEFCKDTKREIEILNTQSTQPAPKHTDRELNYFNLKDKTKWDNLQDVFDRLKKHKFIEGNYIDFKNIFTDVTQKEKIKWIGTAGELSYFIRQLFISTPTKPAKVESIKKQWELTLKYIEGKTKNGKPFEKNTLRYAKRPLPDREKLLNKIVSTNF